YALHAHLGIDQVGGVGHREVMHPGGDLGSAEVNLKKKNAPSPTGRDPRGLDHASHLHPLAILTAALELQVGAQRSRRHSASPYRSDLVGDNDGSKPAGGSFPEYFNLVAGVDFGRCVITVNGEGNAAIGEEERIFPAGE